MPETIRVKFADTGQIREVVPDYWNEIRDNPIGGTPRVIGRDPVLHGYRLERLMDTKDYTFFAIPFGTGSSPIR